MCPTSDVTWNRNVAPPDGASQGRKGERKAQYDILPPSLLFWRKGGKWAESASGEWGSSDPPRTRPGAYARLEPEGAERCGRQVPASCPVSRRCDTAIPSTKQRSYPTRLSAKGATQRDAPQCRKSKSTPPQTYAERSATLQEWDNQSPHSWTTRSPIDRSIRTSHATLDT